jgi:hypothetical protein
MTNRESELAANAEDAHIATVVSLDPLLLSSLGFALRNPGSAGG